MSLMIVKSFKRSALTIFVWLEAPPVRVTGWDTPFPYTLENEYLPRAPRILKSLRETKRYEP